MLVSMVSIMFLSGYCVGTDTIKGQSVIYNVAQGRWHISDIWQIKDNSPNNLPSKYTFTTFYEHL